MNEGEFTEPRRNSQQQKRTRKKVVKNVWLTVGKILCFGFSLLMMGLTLGLLIGKLVFESFTSYITHFTNWNWTILTIFYTVDVLVYVMPYPIFGKGMHTITFWLAYGSAWSVFWLVFVMFGDNAKVLTELTTDFGGKYSMGFVLNMNTLFHYVPAISMTVYLLLNMEEMVRNNMKFLTNPLPPKVAYSIVVIFVPLYFIGIYDLFMNIKTVYGIKTNIGILIVIVIAISVVFNGITLLLIRVSAEKHRSALARYGSWLKLQILSNTTLSNPTNTQSEIEIEREKLNQRHRRE